MGTFIQQGCIKVIKSDSRDLLRKFLFKKIMFFLFLKKSWNQLF